MRFDFFIRASNMNKVVLKSQPRKNEEFELCNSVWEGIFLSPVTPGHEGQ